MKINHGKSKAIGFTRTRVKNPLVCSLGDQKTLEASSFKYLAIILRSDLYWVDQVNYTAQKSWKACHFVMHVLKQGDRNTKCLAYMSLVRPVLEYGATCWDPCREGQINALDRVETKVVQFTNHTKYFDWETLVQRRTITRLSALFNTLRTGLFKLFKRPFLGFLTILTL